jgi:hypothetical protein
MCLAALSLGCATLSFAGEGDIAADFRGEETRFKKSCSGFAFNALASCGELLFTDHPLHIAVGSLAPGNGFGAGVAVVGHWTTTNWRNTFDVDAVGSPNFSWRAGGYATFVWAKVTPPKPHKGRPRPGSGSNIDLMQEQPVIHAYAEADSLNKLGFFGIGPSSAQTARTFFGMSETVTGASFVLPVSKYLPLVERLNISIVGEGNGRFVNTRGENGQGSPSIEQVYSSATAPGLLTSRGFAQFGEGVRMRPSFAGDHVQLDYLVNYQQYVAHNNYSFRRFTTDVSHTFQIYQNHFPPAHQDINGPDECFQSKTNSNATDPGASKESACPPALPPPGPTRNYAGSVQLRFLLSESIIPAGHLEPFYFQPTLGGSDINGNAMLGSFEDYRFRAPNSMMFRAAFEHSIYKWPVGLSLMLDEGKVGLRRNDIDFSHLQHSYSVGLTLHAGGFPVLYAMFSWGGHEGTHTTAAANTSLLGGSARPSLY